jgi:hypothetical protein
LDLLDMDDEVFTQDLDLVEHDKPVHPFGGPGYVEYGNDAAHQKDEQQQAKSH